MSSQKGRLLIIDDNVTNLKVLVGHLETYDFEILTARNGEAGVKKANAGNPDLILLDIQMPGIDGYETCRLLKASENTRDIPIIFMTALSSTEDKVKGFEVGAVDYVTKPFEQAEVVARINTHLTIRHLQRQLQEANEELEERVLDRTRRLQVRAMLSRQMNEVDDLDYLLQLLVNELKKNFDYAHVQISLMADDQSHLSLWSASGTIGQQLKSVKPRQPLHQGITGVVAQTNQHILANNLVEHTHYLPNPSLPNVQSQLAIPLQTGGTVIGVLDVYSDQLAYFTPKDVSMLRSIANELAIAINNIRLLAEREATILELQALDQAKSRFLGVVSHELRTPMNGILGYVELLLEGIYGPLDETVKETLTSILKSSEHLTELINNLLDITQLEMGHLQITLDDVTVEDVVNGILPTLNSKIEDKSLEIIIDVPSTLPKVSASKQRLSQILLNLSDNAIKFTPAGTVTLRAEIDPTHHDKVRFAVLDSGIGIPADQQPTIFEPFKLVDMSATRKYGGLGVGLAIAQQLVVLQGGQLEVTSTVNEGSEFYFSLPRA
ncbi:MAG: response regulator [Chloroflexota bacterium]